MNANERIQQIKDRLDPDKTAWDVFNSYVVEDVEWLISEVERLSVLQATDMRRKVTRAVITIETIFGDEDVTAEIYGQLGVHPTTTETGTEGSWTLSHVSSGRMLFMFDDKDDAVAVAKKLRKYDLDDMWDTYGQDAPKSVTAEIRDIGRQMGGYRTRAERPSFVKVTLETTDGEGSAA